MLPYKIILTVINNRFYDNLQLTFLQPSMLQVWLRIQSHNQMFTGEYWQGTTEDQRHVPRGRVEGGASHSVEISAASKADQLTSGVQVYIRDALLKSKFRNLPNLRIFETLNSLNGNAALLCTELFKKWWKLTLKHKSPIFRFLNMPKIWNYLF